MASRKSTTVSQSALLGTNMRRDRIISRQMSPVARSTTTTRGTPWQMTTTSSCVRPESTFWARGARANPQDQSPTLLVAPSTCGVSCADSRGASADGAVTGLARACAGRGDEIVLAFFGAGDRRADSEGANSAFASLGARGRCADSGGASASGDVVGLARRAGAARAADDRGFTATDGVRSNGCALSTDPSRRAAVAPLGAPSTLTATTAIRGVGATD